MVSKLKNHMLLFLMFVSLFLAFTPFEAKGFERLGLLSYIIVIFILSIALIIQSKKISFPSDLILSLVSILTIALTSLLITKDIKYLGVSSFILLGLAIFSSLLIYLQVRISTEPLIRALELYLLINVLAIAFQFGYSSVTGDTFSFHELIFPFSTDRGQIYENLNLARFTGFHNEPGTYGTWISFVIITLIILHQRPTKIIYLALFSLLLTLSTSAIIYFAVLSLAILYNQRKRINFLSFLGLVTVFIAFVFISLFALGIDEYLKIRFLSNSVVDGTTELKFKSIEFLINSEGNRLLLGSGYGYNDCTDCTSLQDVGVAFNIIFYMGLFALPFLLLLILLPKPRNVYEWTAILIILISKAFIFSPAIWFTLLIMRASKDRKK